MSGVAHKEQESLCCWAIYQELFCTQKWSRGVLTHTVWLCSQLEFPLACPVCKAGPSPACVHCEEVVRGHTNERYCSIDPDVQLVLSPEEYEDYMDKSMKFASNRDSELTSCPKPDCQVSLLDDTLILLIVCGITTKTEVTMESCAV